MEYLGWDDFVRDLGLLYTQTKSRDHVNLRALEKSFTCRIVGYRNLDNVPIDGPPSLTLDVLEHIVVSLDHLKGKLSRAQFHCT